jgi:hypothetical protein
LLDAAREKARSTVLSTISMGTSGQASALVSQAAMSAVVAHLEYACCWQTAQALRQALQAQAGAGSDAASLNVEGMQCRQNVIRLIQQGEILEVRTTGAFFVCACCILIQPAH